MLPGHLPQAIYPYFDKVQVWLRHPADDEEIALLKHWCGRGGVYAEHRPARFDSSFGQRIELRQPSAAAIAWLSGRDMPLINRVEVSIDYIFATEAQRDAAFRHFHSHIVRRWHGRLQKIKTVRGNGFGRKAKIVEDICEGETRYDAHRAANKIVFYRDDFSRVTGEASCLHLEWHLNGLRAVVAAGINSPGTLITFDHHEFWGSRLLLQEIDAARLGRLIRNRRGGTRSKTVKVKLITGGIRYNVDERTGYLLLRRYGCTQALFDGLRGWVRARRASRPLESRPWLPKPRR